ncbi:MAG: LamG domain-containing protein [Planctomycetes bacterium]|nr:LamG domain-containing protein [Planctomycetota bacterium]
MRTILTVLACLVPAVAWAQAPQALKRSLTFHASFDSSFDADFSRGDTHCVVKKGQQLVPVAPSDEVQLVSGAGKFGGAISFPKKGTTRPQFSGVGMLGYNDSNWNATVSVWLRLTPDQDLEPGYCDPVQIVGDDGKKGFIFLEWSKDETPRFFRYAIRPLVHIWNPTGVQWDQIPFEKRPMVQVANAPFDRQRWTHVVFTISHLNDKAHKPSGSLYLDGKPQGRIENWELTLGWDPAQVALVLGASYVGHLDDLAVFDRPLSDQEVEQLFKLERGIATLR